MDTLLLVVPTDAGWEVVDAFVHHPPTVFSEKDDAIAWSSDEAYRRWGSVVVCDEAYAVESSWAWEPPV